MSLRRVTNAWFVAVWLLAACAGGDADTAAEPPEPTVLGYRSPRGSDPQPTAPHVPTCGSGRAELTLKILGPPGPPDYDVALAGDCLELNDYDARSGRFSPPVSSRLSPADVDGVLEAACRLHVPARAPKDMKPGDNVFLAVWGPCVRSVDVGGMELSQLEFFKRLNDLAVKHLGRPVYDTDFDPDKD